MIKFFWGLSVLCLLVAFQNCSNGASFQSSGELVAKADGGLDAGVDGDTSNDDVNPGDGQPVPPVTSPLPPGMSPPTASPTPPPKRGSNGDCDKDKDKDKDTNQNYGSKSSALQFVCVLEGPGTSVKIGLVSKQFVGQNGTPNDVCMTENACLNILSKKFNVKSAERRGFCPDKNPHVIPMTDTEIESSIVESELTKSLE